MSGILAVAADNLLTPAILFFALGLGAALVRSDLEIPRSVGKALSIYLMAAIGYKGGLELSRAELDAGLAALALTAAVLSFAMPLLGFWLLRRTTRLGRADAAAVAAHYGSVSVVTFATATTLLGTEGVLFSGALVAALAIMESPAIVTGLALARRGGEATAWGPVLREALTSGSVLLLVGGLAIGWITGDAGAADMKPFFVDPFQGVLTLFLLEMGLLVARRLGDFRALGWRLVAYGLYMPLIGAGLGLGAGRLLGLDVGDTTLLAVLAASASYIAVPAAMRHALPEANPSIYATLSLAVTFPFNIVLGIPLYYRAAQWLGGTP